MARLDRDAVPDSHCNSGFKRCVFERKEVITKVFAGVGDNRGLGGWIEKLYPEHPSILGHPSSDKLPPIGGIQRTVAEISCSARPAPIRTSERWANGE